MAVDLLQAPVSYHTRAATQWSIVALECSKPIAGPYTDVIVSVSQSGLLLTRNPRSQDQTAFGLGGGVARKNTLYCVATLTFNTGNTALYMMLVNGFIFLG